MNLNQYREVLEEATASPDDSRLFQEAVQGALDLKLFANERDLGQRFGVSGEQVRRWLCGKGLPVIGARQTVYLALENLLTLQHAEGQSLERIADALERIADALEDGNRPSLKEAVAQTHAENLRDLNNDGQRSPLVRGEAD